MNKIAPRKFRVGHVVKRIDSNAEGEAQATFVGTVVSIETNEFAKPHHRVEVRWANGSKSYRPEDGLVQADKSELYVMTPDDVIAAKTTLGAAWGLGRPLHNSELARALRMQGRDPGATVEAWLKPGGNAITGPVQVAIKMMLSGALPPDPMEIIVRR